MIRFKLLAAILLLVFCVSAQAEIKFAIGEPAEGSTRSGIGQISGWAVSDSQIVSVEAFIDDVSLGLVPYGGTRLDVAAAFPDYPNSEFSGWSMKWNYSLLSVGEHELTIVITDIDNNQVSQSVIFSTTGFSSSFIRDPEAIDLSEASISIPEPGRIIVTGAIVEGEEVDIELCWDTASQQFQIERIIREEDENKPENQAPRANAGNSFDVEPGETVVLEGGGIDPDGSIASYAWKQVTGTKVDIHGVDLRVAEFTAPETPGALRFRLTVFDDEGASDDDDVIVEVVDSSPEPEPVNIAPTADAGANRTVEPGDLVSVAGSASDSDGTIVEWYWDIVSGAQVGLNNANTDRVTFTAPEEEGYVELLLTVTDDDGATGSDRVTIAFENPAPPPNRGPSANAGSNKTVAAGTTVTVTGGGVDPDGTIVFWEWEQVSGTSVDLSGANSYEVRFTAPETAGQIHLRLNVTDNDGATDSDDVTITVEAAPEPGPEPDPDDNTTGETVQSMLSVINSVRSEPQVCNGTEYAAVPPLQWDSGLASIAMQHSMDMASKGYFSHTSEDSTSMGDRVFPYWSGTRVGENIAASSVDRSNSFVVDLWLSSTSGHCELLMSDDFTHAGIGAGHNPLNGYTYHHFWTLNVGG
jgi:uncharacterized protein YkwD